MSTLGQTLIERWWENYWIAKMQIMNVENRLLSKIEMHFYFLSIPLIKNNRRTKHKQLS